MSRRRVSWLLILLAALAGAVGTARAQKPTVNWRHDYTSACKEAKDKGVPLIVDFFIVPCLYCDKLDSTTFQDDKIVSLMNERFIPLKVNANVDTRLAELLRIGSYPTLILASPDGKILGTFVGYQDAAAFNETLQRALAGITPPDWMIAEYNQAAKWVGAAEFAPAITALRRIVEDGKGRPIQVNAQKLLADLEKKAGERMELARAFQGEGKTAESIQILTEIVRDFHGLFVAREAGDQLARLAANPDVRREQRGQRAQELLAQARDYYKVKDYTLCIDRCSLLIRTFGDLPEGQEAAQLFAEIKNNPEWLQNACTSFGDRLAEMYLALADSWLRRGQPQQAKHWLERVIRAFPGTQQAESAQIRIDQLQGTPTRRVDFQTPPFGTGR